MTHTYKITGMTCAGCEAKVKFELESLAHISSAVVSRDSQTAIVSMDTHVNLSEMQLALGGPESKYQISLPGAQEISGKAKTSLETYKPILVIFFYIIATTLLIQLKNDTFNLMEWMRHFMAGFFLIFSLFKLLNLKGFAESYVMYDVIARKVPAWAYAYAFIELGLGMANVADFSPLLTNLVTFLVMSASIVGVIQSVLHKRQIRCACLGAVFNLPMSTVTIIEDALMIAMSGAMIIFLV